MTSPVKRLEDRRKRRLLHSDFPKYAVDALQVAVQLVLPEDRADWPDGILYAVTKIAGMRDQVVERLGRDPTAGELAVHYLAVRVAEQAQLNALLGHAGSSNLGQSVPDPGTNQSSGLLDQSDAEQP